ncbi:glycoside hydrolase family 57 [Denitrovibrio acetiphilus DSM 12809]|uniref:Glycoside hydrolase family 57 n=1 Tax=Denitrovibrio acetiphilus (strain DSM 12809 / NBRC 114555 / N2460) TaxID=522772 RepID=D4H3F2_DENA2|nr:glycoside hydrolase family 57 protein [Denitrovibrio acetiphilus]ADD67236.1 glycoside hydrolase family 57 [Denitrovibrio acetiphilus DSM 12809]
MKKLRLCFLWHMHQPYYKDDLDGSYHMPWVYLHGLKDYYELPYYHSVHNIKGTYNLVPSLLVQLKDYEKTDVADTFLQLIQKETAILTREEKEVLVPQLFMANYKNMVTPLRRYKELYDRKGDTDIFRTAELNYSDEELTDMQVLYLISWCGVFTREKLEIVQTLIKKGRHFSHSDKTELLEALADFISDIVPLYRELQHQGKIEVSATPFYHPILPILLEPKSAKEALPQISMASINTDFSADAEQHVRSAISYYESEFGQKPNGMWPAEGSISEKAAALFAQNGIKWIASDEDVLASSIGADLRNEDNRKTLYKKHIFPSSSGDIHIFFRDKELSDLMGFTYSGWDAERAVDDFMEKMSEIFDSCDFSPIVPVILDGENAWEFYPENAYKFFTLLYSRLEACNWIETLTMSEACESDTPEHRPAKIRAGSWIYANFTTWMGHDEKNEAWRLLADAHKRFQTKKDTLENTEQIRKELFIAEGSDWFWWYGDDHFSLQSDTFDKLFRGHIANIYELMGEKVPTDVTRAIKKSHRTGMLKKPATLFTPTIDGRITSFYEWIGAGKFDLKFDAGAMTASGNTLGLLYFGFDKKNLYLRIDGTFNRVINMDYELEMEITTDTTRTFSFILKDCEENCCARDVFEALIPLNELGDKPDKADIIFRLKKGRTVVEVAPLYNTVQIDFSIDFEKDWIA